ncbi:MAG: GNAT family N-acetyltransferase [Candidatus Dormibacteraeota bacterium]|nr:GNAT family N-acetyltransferase [Candidatus Dormibacteraeota bacterium]
MVTLLAGFAFSQLGVARIEALIEPSNSASRALANAVGFVEEGVLRARVTICGQRTDMTIASLIKPELTQKSS